jgi:uncharacterized protein YukE
VSGDLAVPAGDPAALESLAGQLDTAAAGTDSLTSATVRVTADIKTNADWTGSAADGYTAFTGNLARGVGGMQAPLSRIAAAVRGYAGYLRTAQEKASAYGYAAQAAQASRHPADIATATAARQDAESAIAAQQAAGNHAAAEVRGATNEMANPFGPDGPVRNWIEKIHAPWDMLVGDAAVAHAMAVVKQGEELAKDMKEFEQELPKSLRNAGAELEGVLDAKDADYATRVEGTLDLLDDMEANRDLAKTYEEAAEELTRGAGVWRGIGMSSDLLGIAGDYFTIRNPEDGGVMGDVDRGAAAANMGLSGADFVALAGASFEVPIAGQVVLIGTGLYLGGDYLYHHWAPFRDVANDIGHATVAGADDIGHAAVSEAKGLWHGITSIF